MTEDRAAALTRLLRPELYHGPHASPERTRRWREAVALVNDTVRLVEQRMAEAYAASDAGQFAADLVDRFEELGDTDGVEMVREAYARHIPVVTDPSAPPPRPPLTQEPRPPVVRALEVTTGPMAAVIKFDRRRGDKR